MAVSMANGRCRMRGGSPGVPKGNRNAFKHGQYTAKALDDRRKNATQLRAMRELAKEVQNRRRGRFSARGFDFARGW